MKNNFFLDILIADNYDDKQIIVIEADDIKIFKFWMKKIDYSLANSLCFDDKCSINIIYK